MSYWQPGHVIQDGRYVIQSVLGGGGFGVTYQASETTSNRVVAIKTVNAFIQSRPDFQEHQERFVQEAFRLAKCSHNHVLRVDDVCKEVDLWCMVMEYLTGGDLEEAVHTHGVMAEAEALDYIQQIGSALTYIHQQGLLHRDVKPANIMLRQNTTEAVLIDFGLARDFNEGRAQTHTNSRTESFAPIEQYERFAQRGAYTDVYALAATFYYLLTAQLPFPAHFRKQGVTLIPPQQHNPDISDQVNYLIMQGMILEPEERPQTVAEWLGFLNADPSAMTEAAPFVEAPTTMRNYQFGTSSRRHRTTGAGSPVSQRTQPPTQPPTQASTRPATTPSRSASSTSPPRAVTNQGNTSQAKPKAKRKIGRHYQKLHKLLGEAKWKEADLETAQLILKAVGRLEQGWVDSIHVDNFPCEALDMIDRLWAHHSQGRFGFSVQIGIYQEIAGNETFNSSKWKAFGDRVGWRNRGKWLDYDNINFSPMAPKGHLPMLGYGLWGFKGWVIAIANRLKYCRRSK